MRPPLKRRKLNTITVDEVKFDDSARADYLTGFHKRKLARIKHAQEQAAKKEKEEKRAEREELRKQRKADLEAHVQSVHAIFKEMNARTGHAADDSGDEKGFGSTADKGEGWQGLPSTGTKDAEYIDEDAYATVTVEAVDIDRDGFVTYDSDAEEAGAATLRATELDKEKLSEEGKKRVWTTEKPKRLHAKKVKKKKFRYESKTERKFTRAKERSKNSVKAKARREKDGG